eukprot:1152062-Pelagomonas_calceolata.AAC.1
MRILTRKTAHLNICSQHLVECSTVAAHTDQLGVVCFVPRIRFSKHRCKHMPQIWQAYILAGGAKALISQGIVCALSVRWYGWNLDLDNIWMEQMDLDGMDGLRQNLEGLRWMDIDGWT